MNLEDISNEELVDWLIYRQGVIEGDEIKSKLKEEVLKRLKDGDKLKKEVTDKVQKNMDIKREATKNCFGYF